MPQTSDQILTELNRIIGDVLGKDSLQLKPDTKANEVEDWDSLNHIEIVVAVEKHFKIKFNFAELQKFQNVGQMCDNILVKLAQAGG
jgi:acyl carrier protein